MHSTGAHRKSMRPRSRRLRFEGMYQNQKHSFFPFQHITVREDDGWKLVDLYVE